MGSVGDGASGSEDAWIFAAVSYSCRVVSRLGGFTLLRWLPALPALVAFVACTAKTDAPAAADPAAGDPADPSVVAIVSPNGDATFVCSAEVIAPRVVLSAAHCFRGGNYDKTGWTFEIFVGADVHAAAAGDRRVAVTEVRIHPDYQSPTPRADGSDADIAVAFVGEDLALPALPFNVLPLPPDLAGRAARYVGFGANDPAAKGRRHAETARVVSAAPDVVTIAASRSPCHGDSGGPLVVSLAGVDTVIGVGHTSELDDAGNCAGHATYTRTDLFAELLRGAIAP